MVTIHATCVLMAGVGVLLRGPSGSGKSDLALRLIDGGAQLVADDQVELRMDGGRLMASAPLVLSGLLEVRGVGIVALPATAAAAPVGLAVDLVAHERVERLPEADCVDVLGQPVPRLALAAFAASTPAKLRLAVAALATLGSVPLRPAAS